MENSKLITSVYMGDLPQMYLHAKSLAKFWKGNKRLTIAIEGDPLAKKWCEDVVLPILKGWEVDFYTPIKINSDDGWRRQQILRLLAAKDSKEDWVIILGAGNVLVRDFFLYDLYRDNKVIVDIHVGQPSLAHIDAARVLKLNPLSLCETWNITPFCWNTKLVRDLTIQLNNSNIRLSEIKTFDWTEATLYWNFAQDKISWYRGSRVITTGIFGGISKEARLPWQHFLDRIQQCKDDYNVKIFNMHRFHITPQVTDELFKFYTEIGLVEEGDILFYKTLFKTCIKYQRDIVQQQMYQDWQNG